jgi:hypothetical protein
MSDLKISVDMTDLVKAAKTTDQTKQALRLLGQQFSRTGDQSTYLKTINQIVSAQKSLPAAMRMTRSEIMRLGVSIVSKQPLPMNWLKRRRSLISPLKGPLVA